LHRYVTVETPPMSPGGAGPVTEQFDKTSGGAVQVE
jgi:hypothetical protein